jgi:8-oxo-dGTP diphosphatase
VWAFTAAEFQGTLVDSQEGDLKWIPDNEMTSLPLWESDLIFFPWLKKKGVFSAKFDYAGDKMRGYEVVFYP